MKILKNLNWERILTILLITFWTSAFVIGWFFAFVNIWADDLINRLPNWCEVIKNDTLS